MDKKNLNNENDIQEQKENWSKPEINSISIKNDTLGAVNPTGTDGGDFS